MFSDVAEDKHRHPASAGCHLPCAVNKEAVESLKKRCKNETEGQHSIPMVVEYTSRHYSPRQATKQNLKIDNKGPLHTCC
jgi:hypothetical protein